VLRVLRDVARVLRDAVRVPVPVRLRAAAVLVPVLLPARARLLLAVFLAALPDAFVRAVLADRRPEAARVIVCEGIDLPPL